MIPCDKCGGDTKQKVITSKKNGGKYTLRECLNGCMNGQYAYTFFPPKDSAPDPHPQQRQVQSHQQQRSVQQPGPGTPGSSQTVNILKSIDTSLKSILQILSQKTGIMPVQDSELHPDDEIPF